MRAVRIFCRCFFSFIFNGPLETNYLRIYRADLHRSLSDLKERWHGNQIWGHIGENDLPTFIRRTGVSQRIEDRDMDLKTAIFPLYFVEIW